MSQNQQEQSEAKLLAYIEGELDSAGRTEIEKHLEAHPQHRRLLDEMRGMRDWVRWLPKETAPAELAESFQMRLERTMLLDQAEDATRPPMRLNRWPQLRAAAAVAALAVGLGTAVYFALPKPHNQFTAAPPATLPSDPSVALTSSTDGPNRLTERKHQRQALARESEATEKLTDAAPVDAKRTAIPATVPSDADAPLAKGLEADSLGTSGLPVVVGPVNKQFALAETAKKSAEPTEQLAEIARNTYSVLNEDPALSVLLRNSNSESQVFAPPADAHGMFGAAATDRARAEKAAEPAAAAGSKGSAGPSQSTQARSPQPSSPPASLPPAPLASPARAPLGSSLQAGSGRATETPYVMVVLATDTDRAHKQIGDYLAAKGIETQAVNDGYSRRVLDETVAARPPGNAAPAAALRALPVAPAATDAPEQPEAQAPAGAGAAAPAAAPAPDLAPARRPFAAAAPQQQAAAPQPRYPAAPPAALSTAAPAPAPPAALQTEQKLAAAKSVVPAGNGITAGALECNGNIFIARRMTVRQARELQASLRQPAESQWAAVYRQPADGLLPPQQLGDGQAFSIPVLSPSAEGLPAVSSPALRSVNPSNPSNQPAVSLSIQRDASPPAGKLSNAAGLAAGIAPSSAPSTQAVSRAEGLRQKDKAAFRDVGGTGEPPAARRLAGEAVEEDKPKDLATRPELEQAAVARGMATTRHAEKPLAAVPLPATPPAVVVTSAPSAVGGRQDQLDRTALREKRDFATTAPSDRPASQPTHSPYLKQAAEFSRDDQPVDVVIVLQQSPGTQATQPAGK
jgi:anti-sigma factor RsiW